MTGAYVCDYCGLEQPSWAHLSGHYFESVAGDVLLLLADLEAAIERSSLDADGVRLAIVLLADKWEVER